MFRISIYLNMALERRGMDLSPAIFGRPRHDKYRDTDVVALAFAYADDSSDSVDAALARAYEIANVDPDMARTVADRDLVISYRKEQVRSLCAGDVITVNGHAYALAAVGYKDLGAGAGLAFAGGRHPRDIDDLIERVERFDPALSNADRQFIDSLVREPQQV